MTRPPGISGGAAAAGGFGYQVSIGAIAGIHTLRGTPVQWTDGLTGKAPVSVSFETAGPGDDLSLELTDGGTVEIQVKKGLRADRRFWSALGALFDGIHHKRCNYGILVVCPNSSNSVRRVYALALERIGSGRSDGASSEQERLASHLVERGYDPEKVCAHIRIRMVSALEDAGDAIAAARAELGHLCADPQQVIPAWQALCQDTLSAITNKSRRTVSNLSSRLCASGIDINDTVKDSPIAISNSLLKWTMSRTEYFQILGIPKPLPTEQAWLALSAEPRDAAIEPVSSVEQALADYRAFGEKLSTNDNAIDARTIGTFRKLCVVVGGPGSGKSLLLKVIAREFAKDSRVSIRVRLRDLATRMQKTGCGVEEGLMQLGVDGTGVTRDQLCAASLSDLVLLCDGLDECGERQIDIAAGLKDICASHPSYRIIVTTRPIGYSTSELRDWRHYELLPLSEEDTAKHLEALCRCALDGDSVESTHELLPRIHAYLEEGSASQVLARSPLLLAFGAALFLTWQDPSRTKLGLYQRIFHLIDDNAVVRQAGLELPAKAIRNSVLYELGWLITASPLRSAEELERQCAQSIEQALDMTLLQALSVVENTIKYWEEKGLIERLRYPGIDLITFIHKTCGEFATWLHLCQMDPDDARKVIKPVLTNPDWDEILDFATGTPLTNMVAELLVTEYEDGDTDEATLNRLFRVLVHPDVSLSPKVRTPFLEHMFVLAQSEDRQRAYRVGLCLTKHDLSCIPEAEDLAVTLLASSVEWSRLVGWTILVCHFPGSVDQGALEDAMMHFMKRSCAGDFFVLRETKLPIGPFPDRGIFENFLLGALNLLLPSKDTEMQSRLIAKVWKSQPNATMKFVSRFQVLLRGLGREDAINPKFNPKRIQESFDFLAIGKFRAACATILTDVVPSAFLDDEAGPALLTEPKCLAAFCELAEIWSVPVGDIYIWQSDKARLDAVHVLLRAAAYVFKFPVERLALEASQVIATIESYRSDEEKNSYLDSLPKVDVAEINWSRAKDVDIDIDLVEGLVHHPSQWVQHLAAQFINERLHGAARRNACERLLEEATGTTFHWAAALTAEVPGGCELIIHRLEGRDAVGLHYLFENLKHQNCPISPSCLTVLEKRLVCRDAKTAVSAARWCQETASSEDIWLVELLRTASSYWVVHEEPYPKSGGIVPDSPREALLRTQCRIASPAFEELVGLCNDPRSDVRNAAIDGIIRLAKDSNDEKSKVVEGIVTKRFSSQQCERFLRSDIPYQPEELLSMSGLCSDQDSSYRMVAVRHVLSHDTMDPDKALAMANSMRSDDDRYVRDAVYRVFGR